MSVRIRCTGAQRQTRQGLRAVHAWSVAEHGEGTVVALAHVGAFAFELPRFNELSSAVTVYASAAPLPPRPAQRPRAREA